MVRIGAFFKRYWIKHLVAFVLAWVLIIIYHANFQSWGDIAGWYNGTFIAGGSLLLVAALAVLNNFGAFNLASFYFQRKWVDENRKENLYEYSSRKEEQRKKGRLGFLPYIIVGSVFLICSLVLMLIARQ